jgi:hypothetical protein
MTFGATGFNDNFLRHGNVDYAYRKLEYKPQSARIFHLNCPSSLSTQHSVATCAVFVPEDVRLL